MMKKIIAVFIVVVVLVGGILWMRSGGEEETTTQVAVDMPVPVTRGPLLVTVDATGSVVARQEVEIKCKASGEVIKIPVEISDTVKKGDLLAQLDPEDEERSVRKAQVNLTVSEAQLAQSKLSLEIAKRNLASDRVRTQASYDSAVATEKEAATNLKRLKQLREKKMASEENLDSSTTAYATAKASLANAKADLEDLKTQEIEIESLVHAVTIAKQQVESDRIALDDAKEGLDETTITAPLDAVVAERDVEVGQIIASGVSNVSGGTTVMTLADLSKIFVLVSVDESDIGRIALGQKASVTVDAYPKMKLDGQVVRIATKGTESSSVVTFEVKVEVTSPQKSLLKPEMTANVEITVVDKQQVLLVPVNAVDEREDGSFVRVQNGSSTPENRKIVTGESNGVLMEITSGLSEQDTLLVKEGGTSQWKSKKKEDSRPHGPPPM